MKVISLLAVSLFLQSGLANAQTFFYGALSKDLVKNDNCSMHAKVPQIMVGTNASAQANQIASTLNATWIKMLNDQVKDYTKSISEKDACTDTVNAYQTTGSFTIPTELDNVLMSIVYHDWAYTGGAHGNGGDSFLNFNSQTGEVYKGLDKFLEPKALAPLLAMIEQKLKDVDSDFDPTFGWNEIKKSITSLSQINNFNFDPSGIVITYNSYEVASYAAGPHVIHIYNYELQSLGLKKTGPASLIH